MASLKTDEVNLRAVMDGSPMRKELATLDQSLVVTRDRIKDLMAEQVRLQKVMKGSDQYSDQYVKASKALEQNRQELTGLRSDLKSSTERAAELRKEIGLGALSVRELRNEAARLRILRDTATGGGAAWAKFDAQLTEVTARIRVLTNEAAKQQAAWEAVRGQYKLSELSMRELELEANRLRTTLHEMRPGDVGFAKMRADLKATEAQMEATRSGLGPFARAWQGIRGAVVGTFAGVGALFAGGMFLSGIKSWITSSAKLSDAQAEVQRTTGLTKAEVEDLTRSLSKLSTRTARSELLDLAKDAGKLGISAKDDVLAFVAAGDKIKVALGEELGEGAIEQLGKLNQTFKVTERQGYDLAKGMLASGSAINDLANASTADGAFLVDYATRLGGVNTQADISIENTLGYAATLDQLGQRAETSSTAMSRFTLGAFKDTAEYAKIAGMSVKDFTHLLKTDTNEALIRVLKGLNNNNAGLEYMTQKFADMGQEGARSVGVLAALSSNTELLRKQQDIANKSFAEGTSVISAFDRKNSTLGANLDLIGKKLASAFVNGSVVKGINFIIGAFKDWLIVTPKVSDTIEDQRMSLLQLETQILSTNQGSADRVKLIKELQDRYPDYLKNIDAETVSNDELRKSIGDINENLVKRIVLEKKLEENQDKNEDFAANRAKQFKLYEALTSNITRLADKTGLVVPEGKDIQEVGQKMAALVQANVHTLKGGFQDLLTGLNVNLMAYDAATKQVAADTKQTLNMDEEVAQLKAFLGLKDEASTKHGGGTKTTTDDTTTPEGDEERKKREAAMQQMEGLRDDLQKLRRSIELDGLSADEKEIAQLDDKYAEIRKKTLANTQHTAEDVAALEDTYNLDRADLLEKQADERAKRVAAAQLKANQEVNKAEDAFWESKLGDEDLAITKELQRLDELTALYDAAGVDTQDIVRRTEEAIAAIRKKFRDKEKKDAEDARKQAFEEQVKTYRAVAGALGSMNDLLQASYNATGKAAYQQTEQAKVLGLAQIAIASGVGVAEAIKAGSGLLFPANLGAIAMGVGAVLGGVASAVALLRGANPQEPSDLNNPNAGPAINSVPIGEDGLVLDGPSHRNKGLAVINSQTGRQEAELEGGELVMSKRFTAANADQLPALLAASKAGARLTFLSSPQAGINVRGYQQAVRTVRLAEGGFLGSGAVLDAIAAAQSGGRSSQSYDPQLAGLLVKINDKLEVLTEVSAQNKEAVLHLGPAYDKTLDTWAKLKARNSIPRRG